MARRDEVATKTAGLGAAIVVLLFVAGVMTIVALILVMMWFQPGMPRSPSGYLRPDSTWTANLRRQLVGSPQMGTDRNSWGEA